MKDGSNNETPTANSLMNESFMKSFYNVGLLAQQAHEFIGVSPDGVAQIQLPEDEQVVTACVEIKTRTTDNTILQAETVASEFGRTVHCSYGDTTFSKCIPTEHQTQILHQAVVTGLDYGVYVVSKVDDLEGCIIQIIIVHMSQDVKDGYSKSIQKLGSALLEWLYNDEVIIRGYLLDNDFPEWLQDLSLRKIVKSRVKLWYAHFKKIQIRLGVWRPLYPCLLYKHSQQYLYNKSKAGLDKNTEHSERLRHTIGMKFETKYLYRMIDAIVITTWRIEQVSRYEFIKRMKLLLLNSS